MGQVTVTADQFFRIEADSPTLHFAMDFGNLSQLQGWAQSQLHTWTDATAAAVASASSLGMSVPPGSMFKLERERFARLSQLTAQPTDYPQSRDAIIALLQQICDAAEGGDLLIEGTAPATAVSALGQRDKEAFVIAATFGSSDAQSMDRIHTKNSSLGLSVRAFAKAAAARYSVAIDLPTPEELKLLNEARQQLVAELRELGDEAARLSKQAETVKSLETTYREDLKLRSAVQYWEQRAANAYDAAKFSALAFAALFTVYILFMVKVVAPLVSTVKSDSVLIDIALVTLPSLAFFWGMKLIARVYVQNVARNGDANERATMIQVYLALGVDASSPPSTDERLMLMRAICRPGPGDPVDESPQDAILEHLLKRGTGGGA
jgi:hypothetical protein